MAEMPKINLLHMRVPFPRVGGMSRLGLILTMLFLLALVMGPGPGAMWIDGSVERPTLWWGIPALYLWALGWFVVMAGCVVTAALTLWKK